MRDNAQGKIQVMTLETRSITQIAADLEAAHRQVRLLQAELAMASEALNGVRQARRARPTSDRLEEVLRLHASGGIGAIVRQFEVSERHARRLVAKARARERQTD